MIRRKQVLPQGVIQAEFGAYSLVSLVFFLHRILTPGDTKEGMRYSYMALYSSKEMTSMELPKV